MFASSGSTGGRGGDAKTIISMNTSFGDIIMRRIYNGLYILGISTRDTLMGAWTHSDQRTGRAPSPAVACWASDHWVASSNPLRGKFHH